MILASGQIKKERITEELHTENEEETPQINMTALLTDTQVMQYFYWQLEAVGIFNKYLIKCM